MTKMDALGGPLVTVIVPCYNHAAYVDSCLGSLLNETYENVELIVIDDGSSDDSVKVIEAFAPACRKRFVRFEFRARPNKGLCNTLNEALEWARGDFFAVTDSDDVVYPERIAVLLAAIDGRDDLNGIFGGGQLIGIDGQTMGSHVVKERVYTFDNLIARDKAMLSSCGLLRTEATRKVGGYLPGLWIEDWYIMLKLTQGGKNLKIIPAVLIGYRRHATNISRDYVKMLNSRLQILDEFAPYPGLNKIKAQVYVSAAIDCDRGQRLRSLRFLSTAIGTAASIIFDSVFWGAVFRIAMPSPVMNLLRRLKGRQVF